ncbi:MAG: hypothetical protein C4589_11720 [Peptococcaceae bacterium]|jgi:hypothetical protein|nr:MAG: hypothetical protein C4589_11720 [Peptococcaceae bacterium]
MSSHNNGFLVIWRMADIAAPYSDLEQIANTVGFDQKFIPSPPRPRDAWEKATNLKRQILIAPPVLIEKIKTEYGCEPTIRAETRIVGPEIRHIVRSLIIRGADNKDKQLDMKSVAVLKFDDNQLTDTERFVSLYHPDFDPAGAVNGNIAVLIQRMQAEYERQLTTADGQDVRYKIRSFLDTLSAVCMADGTYFVPETAPGAADKLVAFQTFILSLEKYRQTDSPLTSQIYRVSDDGSAFSERNLNEIKRDVVASFKGKLDNLYKRFKEKDNRGDGATARRINEASVEFLEAKKAIQMYRESLQDDLQALTDMMQIVQAGMLGALDNAAAQAV